MTTTVKTTTLSNDERIEIAFLAGTLVKIEGLPFWLASDAVLLGNKANLELIHQDKSLGVPCVPDEAQDST